MIVITTLAEYQTRFWAQVALRLKLEGHEVILLSFDDASTDLLNKNGLRSYNVPALAKGVNDVPFESYQEVLGSYGLDDINYWISHERVTFALKDTNKMIARLICYIQVVDGLFSELKSETKDITLLQELGGFLSVVASFFAARKNGINNIFLEPSFFKGRLFPLLNSFAAPVITASAIGPVSKNVQEVMRSTIASQSIVIPKKDALQYRGAFAKIFDFSNVKRLFEKIVDKYLLGKYQEFGHLGRYVGLHVKMLFNANLMRFSYTPLESLKDFVYFPFHVPGDMALTLRSPEYFDQLSLIEYMLKVVPFNHMVAVKEHPAQIGGIAALRLKQLLERYDNLVVINPRVNNYDVINKANLIVSINSKSGAEAGLLGKPSLVLGEAFYKDSPLVERVSSISDLKAKINESLDNWKPRSEALRDSYFQNVWDETYVGELYIDDNKDVKTFSKSIGEIVANLSPNS
jgi:hypothetical protein